MSGLKHVVERFLSPKEAEKFAEWAFGLDYVMIVNSREFKTRWNELHGREFYIYDNGTIAKDIQEMIDLWRKR